MPGAAVRAATVACGQSASRRQESSRHRRVCATAARARGICSSSSPRRPPRLGSSDLPCTHRADLRRLGRPSCSPDLRIVQRCCHSQAAARASEQTQTLISIAGASVAFARFARMLAPLDVPVPRWISTLKRACPTQEPRARAPARAAVRRRRSTRRLTVSEWPGLAPPRAVAGVQTHAHRPRSACRRCTYKRAARSERASLASHPLSSTLPRPAGPGLSPLGLSLSDSIPAPP